jgi:hypothetical protein
MILPRTFLAARSVPVHNSYVLYVPVRYIPYSALGICNIPYLIFTSPFVSFSIERVCFQTLITDRFYENYQKHKGKHNNSWYSGLA